MKIGNNILTIGLQVYAMRSRFPQFEYRRVNRKPTWIGHLQPTEKSPKYQIKVEYGGASPQVWVLNPALVESAPHQYPDKSLCLYYPQDRSWTPKKYICSTIIPWTAEWLAFYEIWCVTRVWYGAEAPHILEKKAQNWS